MNEASSKSSKHVARRLRLVHIGLDLFSQRSYEEVAIDDIAAAAGISKGLLYYYFPTKHDFYIAVVQFAADQLLQETREEAALEPIERLRAGVKAYFSYVERYATAYLALLRGGVSIDPQVAAILNSVRHIYVQRVLRSVPANLASSPSHLIAINGWVGFVEAISVTWLEERSISQEELCDLAMAAFTVILSGVREPVSTLLHFLAARHEPQAGH